MKKLLSLLCTIAVALALATPVFAKGQANPKGKANKEAVTSTHRGKAHHMRAKKKGATEGKKKGQQATNPGAGPR